MIYLVRNLHEDDVDFLEAFRHGPLGISTPINAIAVLSRADEFGGGAPDAMGVARRRAANLTKSPVLRPLVQTVVPVAGLLAESSATFRQSEFEALKVAAALPPNEADELLLSAERFVRLRSDLALPRETRLALLRRLGLYGVRISVMLLRKNRYASAGELADELRSRSGIEQLKSTLDMVIQGRRDLLKSYATLVALGRALREHPLPGSVELFDQIALLLQSSPILEELDLLTQLRDGSVTVPPELIDEVDRLAGGAGPSRAQRLGLEPLSGPDELDEAALLALQRWRTIQAHPLTCGDLRRTADIIARACESLLDPGLDAAPPVQVIVQSNALSGSMPTSAISAESTPPAP